MRLTWHIVRKDLARLKWILLLWIVVLAGGVGLALVQAGLDHDTAFPFYIAANLVLAGFLPLLMFGLVMGLVHDDPVAELDAFWITRPISGGDLLRAKAVALLLLALLPGLATLPFWLSYDFSFVQIGAAWGQTTGAQLLVAFLALPFAVLSANGSKFVMNVIMGAGGLLLLLALHHFGNLARAPRPAAPAADEAKMWLVAGLWVAGAVAATLNQFLTRRTRWSRAMLIAAAVIGFGVVQGWPWMLRAAAAAEPVTVTAIATTADGDAGGEVFTATINGEAKRTFVVAEVPLREAASSVRRGRMLRLQHVLLDFTGELQVEFSEAQPQLTANPANWLPGTKPRMNERGHYFILNRSDGRALAVTPVFSDRVLTAATLGFFHASFKLRPAGAWQGPAPADLATWLKEAVLIKVVVAESTRT